MRNSYRNNREQFVVFLMITENLLNKSLTVDPNSRKSSCFGDRENEGFFEKREVVWDALFKGIDSSAAQIKIINPKCQQSGGYHSMI